LKSFASRKRVHATLTKGPALELSTTVILTVRFTDSEGDVHTFTSDFDVFPGLPVNLIVGVRIIVKQALLFLSICFARLRIARMVND
jgi:hypothetical protein